MCGIVGQVRIDGGRVDAEVLARMCRAMEHRGPDSRGLHVDEDVGLAMQRLAIVDLHSGEQPIFNEDGTVAVVLNGEIYNFLELRRELVGRGHTFTTHTDTEVIVHLYEEMGPDCVRRLHGMFAFAVWDKRSRSLMLARDRLGKKPLFYSRHGGALRFGSELGALMQDPEIPRDVDHQALDAYLAFRWVPAPLSAYKAVRKLPAASTLLLRDGRVTIDRYWSVDYGAKRTFADERELHEEIRDQIRRATRKRLISDVPLGAFLSGGVDSAAVVAAMAEASSEPVKTFSIGFSTDEYNELPLARRTAEAFGTEHHEFVVEPKAVEVIPRIVRHYGEPFADSSAIPSFYVAEMARRHVTVALNGDGGDETFAGYQRYISQTVMARLGRLPRPLGRAMAGLALHAPESGRVDSWPSRLRRFGSALELSPPERYTEYMSTLLGLDRSRLYTPEYRALVGESVVPAVIGRPWAQSTGRSTLDVLLDVDVNTYLVDDLLVKMDIATMAHSLEGRSPLLDHEFVEFAASLQPRHKLQGTQKKAAFRKALRGWVPDEILDARKRGFRVPIADWFRGELREYSRDILLDRVARQRGYFDTNYVKELLDRHAARRQDHSQAIWTLLNFELWHREFSDDHSRGAGTDERGLATVD
jgi:asparagine synthase (glutamine-hydrolysing)